MQRVIKLARTEVQTTDTYSPWKNKTESVIKIIKVNAKRIIFQRNIPKRVCDLEMVWEEDIYFRTELKDGRPYL